MFLFSYAAIRYITIKYGFRPRTLGFIMCHEYSIVFELGPNGGQSSVCVNGLGNNGSSTCSWTYHALLQIVMRIDFAFMKVINNLSVASKCCKIVKANVRTLYILLEIGTGIQKLIAS